ncbi:MAG: ElyC/SanA/YdcF family protein [Anaerolineae bacterium]
MNLTRRIFLLAAAAGATLLGILLGLRFWIERRYENRIYERIDGVPSRPVALVLGAGLWPDGSLTPILADRVATAAELNRARKVQKLLCSGDNRRVDYNEPQAMKDYAVRLGVPAEDVVLDYAGRRTYDSCYRARDIFGVEQVVVVTQRFHAARAVYTCRALGLDAVAITADRRTYSPEQVVWKTREYLALLLAWWDVNVRRPVPVPGHPEPIDLTPHG